jgi:hypothetical protein
MRTESRRETAGSLGREVACAFGFRAHSAKFSGTRVALSAAYPVDHLVFQFTHVDPTGLDKCRRHFGATLHAQQEGALFGLLELSLFERGFHPKAFHIDVINTSFRNFLPIWQQSSFAIRTH